MLVVWKVITFMKVTVYLKPHVTCIDFYQGLLSRSDETKYVCYSYIMQYSETQYGHSWDE